MTRDEADKKELKGIDDAVAEFSDINYSYKGVNGYWYFSGNNGRVYGRGNSAEPVTIYIPKDAVIVDGKSLTTPGVIDNKAEKISFDDFVNKNLKDQWETGWDGVYNAYFVTFDEKTGYVKDIVFVLPI